MAQLETLHPTLKDLCNEYLLARNEPDQALIVTRLSMWLDEHPLTLDELPEAALNEHDETYARNRLHRCPETGVVCYLMVWRPGQGSPVHDHGGAWGVVRCLGGSLTVTEYEIASDLPESGHAELRERSAVELQAGLTGTTCRPGHEIHSIFNRGSQTAYSLHVYSQEITTYRAFDLEHHTFEIHANEIEA